jgi:serine/threonine-protein kinase
MLSSDLANDPTVTFHPAETAKGKSDQLTKRYQQILDSKRLNWTVHHHLSRLLGTGGQGAVYLSERRGADGFTIPVAIKVFSPIGFANEESYAEAMGRIARVSARIAQIQHDSLLNVHNFVDRNGIRIQVMEWIDGYDLRQLLENAPLAQIRKRVSRRRWNYINRVIVTAGEKQPHMQAGVSMAIIRHCLAALESLHRENIIHGDIKPANIMLKRTGLAKIIDMGSAFTMDDVPAERSCTPAYAAPEVLQGELATPLSDLASLGYVLVELLSGRKPFEGIKKYKDLLEAKQSLPDRLNKVLPQHATSDGLLMGFCQRLIASDPADRFESAEAAELLGDGAAEFQRQQVLNDDRSEYDHEIHLLLEELKQLEASD